MPEFAIIFLDEAKRRTATPYRRPYVEEYAGYIQQLSTEETGKLELSADERPATIQRRLTVAAQTLGIPLTMKRSGEDVYFWIEPQEEAKPRPQRGRRRRRREEPGAAQPVREPTEA
jgi:hypothetical protein